MRGKYHYCHCDKPKQCHCEPAPRQTKQPQSEGDRRKRSNLTRSAIPSEERNLMEITSPAEPVRSRLRLV